MKWAFDNSTKLIGLFSLGLIIVTTVHDWAYFLIIGPKFRSIQTTYDYITSAIEWLPTFLLLVIVVYLVSWQIDRLLTRRKEFGFADHETKYLNRQSKILVALTGPPVVLATAFVGLTEPFPHYLIALVGLVALLIIGGALLAAPYYPTSIQTLLMAGAIASVCLSVVVLAGIFDGIGATETVTNVHKLNLKGGEVRFASVLRTFEKGILIWNPSNEKVQFVRWEQIDELSRFSPKETVTSGCHLFHLICYESPEP